MEATMSTPHTLNYTVLKNYIKNWLETYLEGSGAKGFVMGVSGGIDSAVVSTLCAMTGKPLLVLEMPIRQGKDQVTRAKDHIEWLKKVFPNVESQEIDLTKTFNAFETAVSGRADVDVETENFSLSNTRSRLRMTALYQFAGMLGYLVAGTGNKVEDFGIGFYTKYGDGGVDISPIADLMKSEVYKLGAELEINEAILNAAPTDGLHDDGRTDEDQIGATYDELEWAMDYLLQYGDAEDRDKPVLTERQKEVLYIYNKFHNSNRHKMMDIPVCDVKHLR